MIRFSSFFFLTLFSLVGAIKAQPLRKSDSIQWKVEQNARLFVDPQGKIRSYYSIDHHGVSIYSSPENKEKNIVECKIFWNEINLFRELVKKLPNEVVIKLFQAKNTTRFADSLYQASVPFVPNFNILHPTPQPLKGLKIAIDPGHVAGNMETAAYELKYLNLQVDSSAGIYKPIDLIEGNLTLATGLFLRKQLEEAGAEVFMTRTKPDISSFGLTYNEWLKKAEKKFFETAYNKGEISLAEKNRFIKYGSPKDIFQNYFRFADLYERARLINDYKPDLTIVIHYNVDEKNKPWTKTTTKNYNMIFVPGDLKPHFLKRVENRVELLRLLVSEDIPQSIELGRHILSSFETKLNIPTALPIHATYLTNDCEKTQHAGVYVRNLALTRTIHGPIAYGESIYQDNIDECKLLSDLSLEIEGIKTSKRVKQVAEAYYEGILRYMMKLNNRNF